MKKIYTMALMAMMAMTASAQEQSDTTFVLLDFNENPWNYPLTTTQKGFGPNYDDEKGALFTDTDFSWPVAEGSDKKVGVTVYAVDLDEFSKPSVYACVDNDTDGKTSGYTGEKINVLFTNPGTTMRFQAPEGYKFAKLVFHNFHVPNFMVGSEYEEEFSYEYDGSVFKHSLKVWNPTSPKVSQYNMPIWEGDEKNILFNYPYFTANFLKVDIRLVSDGTTTVQGVAQESADSEPTFDLQGRNMEPAALKKGIYVRGGRKVVVK